MNLGCPLPSPMGVYLKEHPPMWLMHIVVGHTPGGLPMVQPVIFTPEQAIEMASRITAFYGAKS